MTAQSGPDSKMNWNGVSEGRVEVQETEESIIFIEHGLFIFPDSKKPVKQRNVYRWEFAEDGITVYHKRRDFPVFLVKLIRNKELWVSEKAHLCGEDSYFLVLQDAENQSITANWRITGPRKDEALDYIYRP